MVALAGTAIAGPLASKSVLDRAEKKQVRKIAKKQVTRLAPGLTVAKARNANAVDGANASDLRTSSAFDQDSNQINLALADATVASATITTHSSGRILATGSVEIDGITGDEEASCVIVIDGDTSARYHSAPDGGVTANSVVIAVNFAVTLPAGTYEARLDCSTNGTVDKDDAAINVYGLGA